MESSRQASGVTLQGGTEVDQAERIERCHWCGDAGQAGGAGHELCPDEATTPLAASVRWLGGGAEMPPDLAMAY
jgi:ribosome modulation factor